jgi:IS1 family transposase
LKNSKSNQNLKNESATNTEARSIIQLLCEGNSLRATSRITDCSINTVIKLLVDIGNVCQKFHNETVRQVKSRRLQCDEIWSFVYSEQKNVTAKIKAKEPNAGDIWTWTARDADSKLIVSWFVGDRSASSAQIFMNDVASRLANRVQLTTDGHHAYLDAVEDAFEGLIDYAQLVKLYGENYDEEFEKRYSPAKCMEQEQEFFRQTVRRPYFHVICRKAKSNNANE